MDEFGSPIAGGIRAVRRSISSSVFRPVQRQESVQAKPDPITTNLLSQNSLTLTSISRQLQSVSTQIASLNFSLNGIKENLALNERLEKQREAAKQNRERILAEQGLREGKESALERKIQFALTSPLRRVAAKTRGILGRLQDFFLILAGGWLTSTGIDLLQALSEGNTEKINELKSKFTKGLLLIGGTITALQIGIGVTINLLARFVGTVARVAFGGILKLALGGVKRLLGLVVGQAIGSGIGGAVGGAGAGLLGGALGGAGVTGGAEGLRQLKEPRVINKELVKEPKFVRKLVDGKQRLVIEGADDAVKAKGFFGRSVDKIRGFFGQKPAVEGGRTITKKLAPTVAKTGAKKGIMSFLKSGAGKILGKIGGPFLTFIFNLASGEGIGGALAAAAGFAAGAKIGASLGAAIGAFFGGIGAIPGAFIGGLIGGLIGEQAMKGLFRGIQSLFGFGKKSEPELPELTYKDFYNEEEFNKKIAGVTPVENNNEQKAMNISDTREGEPSIINIPALSGANNTPQISMDRSPDSGTQIPSISFDNNNPHTLFATATYGV